MQAAMHTAPIPTSTRVQPRRFRRDTLTKLYVGRLMAVEDIAQQNSCTVSEVISELSRHSIALRTNQTQRKIRELRKFRTPDEKVEAIVREYTISKLSVADLASRHKIAETTVNYVLRKRGVLPRREHFRTPVEVTASSRRKYQYKVFNVKTSDGKQTTVSIPPELDAVACERLGGTKPVRDLVRQAVLDFRKEAHVTLTGYVAKRLRDALGEASTATSIKRRRKTRLFLNESFFDKWTPEMAWVLGLMATDGHMSNDMRSAALTSKDYDMLHNVRELLEYSGDIRRCNTAWRLTVSRKALCTSLLEKGISPRKTFTVDWSDMPIHLQRHFLRGLWDGDGGVSLLRDERALRLTFTSGSETLALNVWCALKAALPYFNEGGREPGFYRVAEGIQVCNGKVYKQNGCVVIGLNAKQAVKEFYDYLYRGVPLTQGLYRKRKLIEIYLELEEIRQKGLGESRLH